MSRRCETHLLKRVKREDKEAIFKCQRCPSYFLETIVIGHSAECWKCRKPFIMNVNSLQHKPTCGCMVGSKSKVSTTVKDAKQAVIDDLLSKIG